MERLKVSAIWNGMTALLAADLQRMFFVAAPFTLLIGVAVDLFGPPAPTPMGPVSQAQLLWRLAVPNLLAVLAQLAISHMVLFPAETPRRALGAALALFPIFVAAQLLAALPIAIGFSAVLAMLPASGAIAVMAVPFLYLFVRLFFLAGAVAVLERGSPVAILRRSWELSRGQALPLCLFIVLGLFSAAGILILSQGAGAAIDVVARAAGLAAVGHFALALLTGIGSTIIAVATAVAGAAACRLLMVR